MSGLSSTQRVDLFNTILSGKAPLPKKDIVWLPFGETLKSVLAAAEVTEGDLPSLFAPPPLFQPSLAEPYGHGNYFSSHQERTEENPSRFSASPGATNRYGTSMTVKQGGLFAMGGDMAIEGRAGMDSFGLMRENGMQLSMSLDKNARVIEKANGDIYIIEGGTEPVDNQIRATLWRADGTLNTTTVSLEELEGEDAFILSDAEEIELGEGNNIVFAFAEEVRIRGGNGNDSIHLSWKTAKAYIDTGEGNDRVYGFNLTNSVINMGDGDNVLKVNWAANSVVILGNGNNAVSMFSLTDSRLELGNGNNDVNIVSLRGSGLSLGDGDNLISVMIMQGSSILKAGHGDNRVKITEMRAMDDESFAAILRLGDGANRVSIDRIAGHTQVELGDGDNEVLVGALSEGAKLQAGHGDNRVRVVMMEDRAALELGDGANLVSVYSLKGEASVTAGHGDNSFYVHQMDDSASLRAGDGGNMVRVRRFGGTAFLALGDGDNTILLAETGREADYELGRGNNSFVVYGGADAALNIERAFQTIQHGVDYGDIAAMLAERPYYRNQDDEWTGAGVVAALQAESSWWREAGSARLSGDATWRAKYRVVAI